MSATSSVAAVRAPGKLFLTGAYAVLEGATAIVLAVDRYAQACVTEGAATSSATRPEIAAVARALHAAPPSVDTSSLELAGRKLGLGSSAAGAVAAAGTILLSRGYDLDEASARAEVHAIAARAHAEVQPRGSGGDVAASAIGGAIAFRRAGVGPTDVEALSLSVPAGLVIRALALPRSTRTSDALERLSRRRSERATDLAMSSLAEAAALGWKAFSESNTASFLEAASAHVASLEQLGRAIDLPLVPAELALARDLLFEASPHRDHASHRGGVVLFPSGAGGGDTVLWLGTRAPTDHEAHALRELGLTPLSLELSKRGVHAASPSSPHSRRGSEDGDADRI